MLVVVTYSQVTSVCCFADMSFLEIHPGWFPQDACATEKP